MRKFLLILILGGLFLASPGNAQEGLQRLKSQPATDGPTCNIYVSGIFDQRVVDDIYGTGTFWTGTYRFAFCDGKTFHAKLTDMLDSYNIISTEITPEGYTRVLLKRK